MGTVVWHITCSCIMLRFPFIVSSLVYYVSCHEYFPGKCPTFTPMDEFDWVQVRQLPYSERVGLDHEYIYTGKLYVPQEKFPARMLVRFPLNVVGSSSFVVLDTNYDTYALVCTCQDIDLFLTSAHRHLLFNSTKEKRRGYQYH